MNWISLTMPNFTRNIKPYVHAELAAARQAQSRGQWEESFRLLERAHVLGQHSTALHVRAHLEMLKWALRCRSAGEVRGQLLRIVGAATKTAFGLVPTGNTGGSNVSPIKPMPVPADLRIIIQRAQTD